MQKIIVQGQPQGKLRARHGKNYWTGKPQTYTPEKTKTYEDTIAWNYRAQGGRNYGDKYVRLGVIAYYGIPQSWTKKKQQQAREGSLLPSVKPDVDNVLKAVLDALNGVAYIDDTQVVKEFAEKYYSDRPRIEIYIEAATPSGAQPITMNEKNQVIEKMAKEFSGDCDCIEKECEKCAILKYCKAHRLATNMYNAGYRKQSEVVKEIFEKIEDRVSFAFGIIEALETLDEIKKEYTEGKK